MKRILTSTRLALLAALLATQVTAQSAQVIDDRLHPPSPVGANAGSSARPAPQAAPAKAKARRHSGVSQPPPALQETPAPPQTPAQLPPSAPQVSYRDGMLTVIANNSTLGDILNAVRSTTGASVEYPPAATQERVVAAVGPAPAAQVLATLLNGSRFDYILLGTDGRPDVLQRAIITAKQGGAGGTAPGGPSMMGAGPTPRTVPPPGAADDDENAPPDEAADQPEPTPPPVQQAPAQLQQQYPAQPGQPIQPTPGQQPGSVPPPQQQPKTPEQLLQELQRLQQQQQQQLQQPEQPPQ